MPNDFLSGLMVAIQYLLQQGEDVHASEIVKLGNYSKEQYIQEAKKTGFMVKDTVKFLREHFNGQ